MREDCSYWERGKTNNLKAVETHGILFIRNKWCGAHRVLPLTEAYLKGKHSRLKGGMILNAFKDVTDIVVWGRDVFTTRAL